MTSWLSKDGGIEGVRMGYDAIFLSLLDVILDGKVFARDLQGIKPCEPVDDFGYDDLASKALRISSTLNGFSVSNHTLSE